MKNNYVLIDFENIQPKNLALLNGHGFKVIVFVGSNQTKIPFELATALQAMGSNAEYVKISGNGSNALDFHIAFYIGQLAERDPNAYFHVVSKDAGFDPLLKHLGEKNILAQREKDLTEIPLLRISNAGTIDQKIAEIVRNFAMRGHSKPRKTKTLKNTINAMFMKTLEEAEVMNLIGEMEKRGLVVIENENVSYGTPISQP